MSNIEHFFDKFKEIYNILEDKDYQKLIDKLNLDIRIKCDCLIDGDTSGDWIIEYNPQYNLCMKIDDITDYLETFLKLTKNREIKGVLSTSMLLHQ